MPMPAPLHPTPLLVACLCAEWCSTCREYRTLFDQLAAQMAGVRFVWIDIEDDAELVDPIEVEDFPTVLIASRNQAVFFGTVLPHIQTLQRLIETQHTGSVSAAPTDVEVKGLIDRLWQRTGTTP